MAQDYQLGAIKTVRNLCNIALILIVDERRYLLPTVLELMHLETQDLIDEYCIEGEENET